MHTNFVSLLRADLDPTTLVGHDCMGKGWARTHNRAPCKSYVTFCMRALRRYQERRGSGVSGLTLLCIVWFAHCDFYDHDTREASDGYDILYGLVL